MTAEVTSTGFEFSLRGLRIGDGDMLPTPGAGSVIAIVGANNAGKSTLLSQLWQAFISGATQQAGSPRILTGIQSPWKGSPEDLEAWLRENARIREFPTFENVVKNGLAERITTARNLPTQGPGAGNLTGWFVNQLNLDQRMNAVHHSGRLGSLDDEPTHPNQILFTDHSKRDRITELARRLFGVSLHFDSISANVGFRLGNPGLEAPRVDEITREYAIAVSGLPTLDSQGDGMKSALGLLIPLEINTHPVALVDEPEAFLHPPQARVMGREIGRIAAENRSQTILATHDKNLLQGLVESKARVTIVHLTRTGDSAAATLLSEEDIESLWNDVTLRYGNALDGLFHSAVIVTENDRDSHFYAAAIDAYLEALSPPPPAHNVMFLGSNGKTNMAGIVDRLRKLGIRVVTCPDLDILDSNKVLRRVVEAHGGNWDDFEELYKKATNQFRAAPKPPTVDEVKQSIDEIFSESAAGDLSEELAKRIKAAAKLPDSTWARLKESGDRAFKDAKDSATSLLAKLDALGIVTVRVGVLENFLTTVSVSKGSGFLPVAFEHNAHKSADAVEQAKRLIAATGIRTESDAPT